MTFVSTVLAGAVGTVAYESLQPWIERKVDVYRADRDDERERRGDNLEDLFPFVNYVDIFTGQRHSGAECKLGEIGDYLGGLADADRSVYDEDHVEGCSTNELFQTLDFVIATNIALNDEGPERVFSDPSLTTDFTGDLVAVGGHISSLYTRNLMYGDTVDLPYRYDLNPDDGSADISDASALELRESA